MSPEFALFFCLFLFVALPGEVRSPFPWLSLQIALIIVLLLLLAWDYSSSFSGSLEWSPECESSLICLFWDFSISIFKIFFCFSFCFFCFFLLFPFFSPVASSRLQCLPAWQRHDAHHHFLVLAAACWLHGPFHDLVQRRVLRSPPVFLRVCLSASLPLDLVASLVIHFTRCQFLSLSQDTSWRVVCGVSRHRIESHLLLLLLLLVFSPQATTTCPGQAARRSFHLWACSSLAPSSFEHAIVVQPPKITNFASDTPWVPLWRPCLRTLIMEMSLFVSAARVSTTPVTCCCSKSVWTSFTLPPPHSLKWASTINTLLLPLATLLTIEGSQEVTRGARCAQAHKENQRTVVSFARDQLKSDEVPGMIWSGVKGCATVRILLVLFLLFFPCTLVLIHSHRYSPKKHVLDVGPRQPLSQPDSQLSRMRISCRGAGVSIRVWIFFPSAWMIVSVTFSFFFFSFFFYLFISLVHSPTHVDWQSSGRFHLEQVTTCLCAVSSKLQSPRRHLEHFVFTTATRCWKDSHHLPLRCSLAAIPVHVTSFHHRAQVDSQGWLLLIYFFPRMLPELRFQFLAFDTCFTDRFAWQLPRPCAHDAEEATDLLWIAQLALLLFIHFFNLFIISYLSSVVCTPEERFLDITQQ